MVRGGRCPGFDRDGRGILPSPIRPSRARMTCPAGLWTRPARAWRGSRSGRSAAVDEPETVADGDDRRRRAGSSCRGPGSTGREGAIAGDFGLFARAPDGRVGWLHGLAQAHTADGKEVEIELMPVSEVRGRLIDQNGRPIAGVGVSPTEFSQPGDRADSGDSFRLSPELTALYRTTTAADGSFVLKGIPRAPGSSGDRGPGIRLAYDLLGHDPAGDDRARRPPGADQGPLKPPDARGLPVRSGSGRTLRRIARQHRRRPARTRCSAGRTRRPARTAHSGSTTCRRAGTWSTLDFDQDGLVRRQAANEIEVGPGAVARLEIPLERLPTITGRVVDAQTGKGIAGIADVAAAEDGNMTRI